MSSPRRRSRALHDPTLRAPDAPLRLERGHAGALLACGLTLLLLASAPPAVALRDVAPEVAGAIAACTLGAASAFAALVLAHRRRWLTTTVVVSDQALEVRRTSARPERVRLVDIRRMRRGAAGLVVWSASGRQTRVGRLARGDAARLAARLESRTGVPVEDEG